MTPGIAIGELCPACAQRVRRRAARIARYTAFSTTFVLAVYVTLTLPRLPSARIVGAMSVGMWFFLTFIITKRVATEWMK